MNVQLRHLRAFVQVARSGVFTRAAEVLGVSQPALTVIISQFEEQLGFRLFDRTTRRVWLTQEGATFLPTAEHLLEEFDAAISDLRAVSEHRRGRVSVAVLPSVAVHLLPRVIKAFSERYPAVGVLVSDANANAIQQRVLRQDVDFGISSYADETSELELTPLIQDKFGLVCRADHRLGRSRAALSWSELRGYPFLGLGPDTGIYPILARVEILPDSVRHPQYVVSNIAALEGLLQAGLGITALPELAAPQPYRPRLVYRPLVDPVQVRTIGLLTRRGRSLSPTAESFRRLISETLRSGLSPTVSLSAS